jgi:uncharacterized protein YeeX (DUF496 family)
MMMMMMLLNRRFKHQARLKREVQEEKVLDEQKRAKVYRNLLQLESSFNPEASKVVERIEQGREILLDHATMRTSRSLE